MKTLLKQFSVSLIILYFVIQLVIGVLYALAFPSATAWAVNAVAGVVLYFLCKKSNKLSDQSAKETVESVDHVNPLTGYYRELEKQHYSEIK